MRTAVKKGLQKLGRVILFFCLGMGGISAERTLAVPNYHLVGLTGMLIPGAGQMLLGNYSLGLWELSAETGSFVWGYLKSPRVPMTLDGATSELPSCTDSPELCEENKPPVDIRPKLWADWAQEFGIKYHFTNVFVTYRAAAKASGVTKGIDQSPVPLLFLAPFNPKTLLSFYFLVPLGVETGLLYYNYLEVMRKNKPQIPLLTTTSTKLYRVSQFGMYPVGSAAPEEMFFRGFLQHEFYSLIPSPWFSIPVTSALFALCHDPDERYGAFAGGLLFGLQVYLRQNNLDLAIATHYWFVTLLGLENYFLLKSAHAANKQAKVQFSLAF